MKIFTPIVEHLHLQVRFNLKSRNVEIKVCCFFYLYVIIVLYSVTGQVYLFISNV